jgi:glucose-6-phosphate 1-dehydrogenase
MKVMTCLNTSYMSDSIVMVIFGITGDLSQKKVIPALYHLFIKNKLPLGFSIIAFGRREWTDTDLYNFISETLSHQHHIEYDKRKAVVFAHRFVYHKGEFDDAESFTSLAEKLNKMKTGVHSEFHQLLYLAVPPTYYKTLFTNLSHAGFTKNSKSSHWTRVLVEKPFGNDAMTAHDLDIQLGSLFDEDQIYRIDHYLAKEMLRNILVFRFSNNILDDSWSAKQIEKIEVRLFETHKIGSRGAFYDGVGALRDIGQNHVIQMLAAVTMENPGSFDAAAIRKGREDLLSKLTPMTESKIKLNTKRAQYKGYRDEDSVAKDSMTETYFSITHNISSPRWEGVSIVLEGGKAMESSKKEIIVTFKHPKACLCPASGHLPNNRIIFRFEPKEEIVMEMFSKKPGYSNDIIPTNFTLPYRMQDQKTQLSEEYERLLMDAMVGDQTLFVTTKEVKSMWEFIDPIVGEWGKDSVELSTY